MQIQCPNCGAINTIPEEKPSSRSLMGTMISFPDKLTDKIFGEDYYEQLEKQHRLQQEAYKKMPGGKILSKINNASYKLGMMSAKKPLDNDSNKKNGYKCEYCGTALSYKKDEPKEA